MKCFNNSRLDITLDAFNEFAELPPNSRRLMINLLKASKPGVNEMTIKATHKELGFEDSSNFSKARLQLVKNQFVIYKDGLYFINPCKINCYNRRQLYQFKVMAGLIKDTSINFGLKSPIKNRK